jgi:PadR family transcriptional regulator, regulatory protein PadR
MAKQDEKGGRYQNRIELLQGTLDMLILQTLQWGPQHGYGISQAIRTRSGEVLQVETGSLYPALHRLERQGWVRSEWKLTESNQRAKYYRITLTGKKQLASDHGRWQQMVEAIGAIMSVGAGSIEPERSEP